MAGFPALGIVSANTVQHQIFHFSKPKTENLEEFLHAVFARESSVGAHLVFGFYGLPNLGRLVFLFVYLYLCTDMPQFVNVDQATMKLYKLSGSLSKAQLEKVIAMGLNASLRKGRTEARKAVKATYNIPQHRLSAVNYQPAKTKGDRYLWGGIYAGTKPIPLAAFAPRFQMQRKTIKVSRRGQQSIVERKRISKDAGKGTSVEVVKGQRKFIPFAFMIPGAKPHVFARGRYTQGVSIFKQRNKREKKEGSDTHVNPLMGVTIHQAVINDKVIARLGSVLREEAPKDLAAALRYQLLKAVK